MAIQNVGSNEKPVVVVVMIPFPAQGHLNQLLHLSRLITAYNIPVHYVGTATHNHQAKTRVQGWNPLSNSNIIFHELIPIISSFHNPGPDPNDETRFPTHIVPSFYAALKLREPIYKLMLDLSSTSKRVVVIHDSAMTYHAQDVPSIHNAESYCFQSISAFTLSSFFWESVGKPSIPEKLIFEDLPSRESLYNSGVNEMTKLNRESKKVNSGNLYNTCRDIEGRSLDLLARFLKPETDKNWAIGPFNPLVITCDEGSKNKRHACMEWLDKQLANSVIFVSFGTTTTFSDEEVEEIAVGLEKSGQKFIWVLRDADKGDVFIEEFENIAGLPEGYEERIKERGVIIRGWAPQLEILGHPSTGGFVSHCGWNSCIESISLGVPIAAWPMHSDQPRNAILITKVLKIGILVRDWDRRNEVVKAETIAKVVRTLMDSSEGEEMRKTVVKMSQDVKESRIKGGQSHLEMESFITHIHR